MVGRPRHEGLDRRDEPHAYPAGGTVGVDVEFNLAILAAVAAIALAGPGAYSLDAVLGIRFPEPITLLVGTILLLIGVAVALGTRAPEQAAEKKPQVT